MAIAVADIVRVETEIRSTGRAAAIFGIGMLVTTDNAVLTGAVGSRVRKFTGLQGLDDAGFLTTSEPYLGAKAWFAQSPVPKNLYVARWRTTGATESILTTGPITDVERQVLNPLSDGSFTINGVEVVTDFGGGVTLHNIANAIESIMRGLTGTPFGDVAVTVSGTSLVFTFPSIASNQGGLGSAGVTGTDIATTIHMTAATGATYSAGQPLETFANLLDDMEMLASDGFYYLMLDNGVPSVVGTAQTNPAVAAAISSGTRRYMFSMQESGDAALVANEVGTDLAILAADEPRNVMVTWSSGPSYKHVSAAARLSAQDFSGTNKVITLRFKNLPGEDPDIISRDQATELERKRANWFTTIAGYRSYRGGFTLHPEYFADAQVFLDWIANEVERNQLALLHTELAIPQTPTGGAMLTSAVNRACERGRRAGGLAAGAVDAQTRSEIQTITGNYNFDGDLVKGYLTFFESFASQSAADRATRVAPDGHLWLKYRGAVHELAIHALLLI